MTTLKASFEFVTINKRFAKELNAEQIYRYLQENINAGNSHISENLIFSITKGINHCCKHFVLSLKPCFSVNVFHDLND